MENRDLICIGCPLGCMLHVEMENEELTKISGHTCLRGELYAKKEITNPTRFVTTTVKVINGEIPMVSVKTNEDIPKNKTMECMKALKNITVRAPVSIGDVILKNVAGTNVNVVATKNVRKDIH